MNGEVPERSKGADCKSVGSAFEGSNPSLPICGVETVFQRLFFVSDRMMENKFYSQGLNFTCARCSHCCRHEPGYVYLSQIDLTNLCQCFNLEEQEFIDKYCRWVPYYDGSEVLCLREKENYDCILWDIHCQAYGGRPIQCSTYPFWTWILESEGTWIQESKDCPGINKGQHWSCEQIQANVDRYKNNIPIRKQER